MNENHKAFPNPLNIQPLLQFLHLISGSGWELQSKNIYFRWSLKTEVEKRASQLIK